MVFEETSGQTHQMDSIRAFVLTTIAEKSVTAGELCAELVKTLKLADAMEISPLLSTVLAEFDRHGLVETAHQ